jgi:hypothetical protein
MRGADRRLAAAPSRSPFNPLATVERWPEIRLVDKLRRLPAVIRHRMNTAGRSPSSSAAPPSPWSQSAWRSCGHEWVSTDRLVAIRDPTPVDGSSEP